MTDRLAQHGLSARSAAALLAAVILHACGGSGAAGVAAAPTAGDPPIVTVDTTPGTGAVVLKIQLFSPVGGASAPFTLGHALKRGALPVDAGLSADGVTLQTTVMNRWDDGSAKFAVLSGLTALPAGSWKSVDLRTTRSAADSASRVTLSDLKATGVTASIEFPPFGTARWAGADWDLPAQQTISGPQMSAWTFRKPVGDDGHLEAWLEVRAYRTGVVEVLPWVENGRLLTLAPGSRTGSVRFMLNDSERFRQELTLLNHQRAPLVRGATFSHWITADLQVVPRHDMSHMMASGLVPNYQGRTAEGSALLARLPSSSVPLGQASYPDSMGSTGYDPSIGLLPEWDVAYLTSGGDARAWRSVVINSYSAGRYGIHYRDESTRRPLAFSRYPHLVMAEGSGVIAIGASTTNSYTPRPTGASPPIYALSHHPSMGYMAYLLTGWNFHLEQLQFLATANFLKQQDGTRQGTQGIFESAAGANTTRGVAWALRTLAQAAAVTPDADPLRAEFLASIDANITRYHQRYVGQPNNPLGLVQPYSDYDPATPAYESASWMDDFLTAAFGYLKDLDAASASSRTRLDAFLQWKYRSVVGRLGGSGSAFYSYRYAAQYSVYYSPTSTPDYDKGTGPWYRDWGDVARAMRIPPEGEPGQALESGYPTEPTSYWGNLMPALAYAVDHRATGALDAWQRVQSAANFSILSRGYNDYPVWGVVPRTP